MTDTDRLFLEALGRYERPLIRYAMSYTRELEDARDVVQDVFLKLSQNIDLIDTERMAAWLFTTCRNRALDLYRKNRRLVAMDTETIEMEIDPVAGPLEHLEAGETAAALHRMINELPARQKQAVWLKFIINLSYQEISQVMETSIGNVGYLIHHGVAAMRTKWKAAEAVN
ncbi:MAG: sigma-70 family RNA polymerase sigma factor [Verrucomicrobiaceae bacterium]|nr:sigma-70 family RNA polymerase sigma factor [Verrucomicrobiaceae bacterium]